MRDDRVCLRDRLASRVAFVGPSVYFVYDQSRILVSCISVVLSLGLFDDDDRCL